MRALLCLLAAAIGTMAVAQDHVRFIVTGDDRWNTGSPRPGQDQNGVNVTDLTRLNNAIIAEKPDVLLFSGDLVGGGETDAQESSQFDTWIQTMKPVYAAGIKVLTVRGNHEMHCPNPADVWRKAMSGPRQNPDNGPDNEKDMTFTYALKNCLFIGLDEFQTANLGVNQEWLDKVLNAPHPPHIFAFAHKMAFFSGNHTDGLETVPAVRDALIKSLAAAGARTVFFGHDHLYDHTSAKLDGWTDDQAIHQIVIGTAGAPFVNGKKQPATDGVWTLNHIAHVEHQLGYAVVDVDGPKVTIVYKSESSPGNFQAADTFSYTVNK
jgi:hypothetical protein